ncbi:MAG: beta-lactamase family protein [Chloroflexi bacterium]|nr:beta-lactamase family protein [Chloroflexota bacterium]
MLTNFSGRGKLPVPSRALEKTSDIGHDARTSKPNRSCPAVLHTRELPTPTLRRLRAPAAASLLSLLVLLAPDLTLAPLSAVEPQRAGPVPIDRIDTPAPPRRLQPIDVDAAVHLHPPPPSVRTVERPPPIDEAEFEAAIWAAREAGGAYGITFAAMRDGELLWSGAAGRDRDGTASIAADDPLVIGSVTKTFVAATILQLAEEGRLDLDDPVRDHLPDAPSFSEEITIRQLLDHSSGLADVFNDTTRTGLEEEPGRAWTTAEVFETIHAPWYQPGEGWAYANTNYFLLGLVIQHLTGTTLADELETRFLDPLELDDTRLLTGTADDGGPLSPAWATIFWASGAMSASAEDLARWGDALYAAEILSDESRREMIALNSHDYGLGLQRVELPGALGYGHTGLLNTYTTLLVHLPEHDVTMALLVNRSQVDLGGMLTAEPPNGPSLLELVGVEPPALP